MAGATPAFLTRVIDRPPVADDAARWASSGSMALTGHPDGPPLLAPSGLVPFVDGLTDELARVGDALGRPLAIDGLALLGERAAIARLGRRGRVSCGGACALRPTRDGWLAMSLVRPEDWDLVPAWLGTTSLDVIAGREARALATTAGELGLPVAALGEAAESPAVTVSASSLGSPRAALDGVLVVDLSSLWAGPLAAALLASAGARVVKVESVHRPDGARRGPARFFDLLHAGQESVALDFADDGDRELLHTLVDAADVVIEASRPRALAQLGVDATMVAERGAIWLSITGYGRAAPLRVAFGDDAAVAGGLVAAADDGPVFAADAAADPLSGLAGAVAVLDALVRGEAGLLDLSMAGVAALAARGGAPSARWSGSVAAPRARSPLGEAARLGADTGRIRRELAAHR